MVVSDCTRIINEFRRLLQFIRELPTKKCVLENLTQQDCKNLIHAYDEFEPVVKFLTAKKAKKKKPDRPKSA